ncbi:2OG-Fe(II) oxygenase [Pseudomonas sp. LRF_L74]|uniref:2OG-Fe(II) oxygenase n=1 Tax=Pseudomonas sp. LRF_L74 TaxID=3369422 RepID=UPI003F6430AF
MHDDLNNLNLPRIIDDLATRGWSWQERCLPEALTLQLADECRKRARLGALAPASVGRGGGQAVRENVRSDRIQWLENGEHPACDRYLAVMDALREALNRALFIGLADYECHFAFYPPGAFYSRHLDRFRDDDRRTVSAVFYLNQDWAPEEGGALRLYPDGGEPFDVPPQAGSLALFMSAEMPHEVLPASRDRLSLTGWFRRR